MTSKLFWRLDWGVFLAAMIITLPSLVLAADKDESEIMSLIGLKIAPTPNGKQGDIAGWHSLSGSSVSSSTCSVYLENGYMRNEGGFILVQLDKDMTRTVRDGRVVSKDLLRYELKNEKLAWRKDAVKKYGVENCEKAGEKDAVIGLMRPERGKEGCLHYSKQVKMAWRVNAKTCKLEEIPSNGVVCFFPDAEDECS